METETTEKPLPGANKAFLRRLVREGKGILLGVVVGILVGLAGGLFSRTLQWSEATRLAHPWLLWGLPAVGLLIVFLYRRGGEATTGGTNLVIRGARGERRVSKLLAPLIFAATVLTNLFGGSAGREGAALQMGGSIAAGLGRKLRQSEACVRMMVICGMAAGFSALFGSKLSAVVFALEISCVGLLCLEALLPCLAASLTAGSLSGLLGGHAVTFVIPTVTLTGLEGRCLVLGLLCGLVGLLVCHTLEGVRRAMEALFCNDYLRVLAGGVLVVALTLLLGDTAYLGTGQALVERAVRAGLADPADFACKLLFTAITLSVGFKGGEIVPVLAIGATFGCVAGPFLGLPAVLGAGVGMIALFCAVTNCPAASLALGWEVFGLTNPLCFVTAVAAAFLTSGQEGLYAKPKFAIFAPIPLDGKIFALLHRHPMRKASLPN